MTTTELGPISRAIGERPPFGPIERLDHDRLVKEQQSSSTSPRRRYSLSARVLFSIMDAVYGRERTLEHEYAHLVDEHPEWETTPYAGAFTADFGAFDCLADLFRQIGYDERLHKVESELHIRQPRFR